MEAPDGTLFISHESQLIRHSGHSQLPDTAPRPRVRAPQESSKVSNEGVDEVHNIRVGDLLIYHLQKERGTFAGVVLGQTPSLLYLHNVVDTRKRHMHNYELAIGERKMGFAYRYMERGREFDTAALTPRKSWIPITSYEKRSEMTILTKMRVEDFTGSIPRSMLHSVKYA